MKTALSLRQWMLGLIVLGLVAALVACATSPTGRTQLKLFSSSEVAQMGSAAFAEMLQQKPVVESGPLMEYVQCVARPMTRAVGGEWRVTLFDDDTVNAFALPGNNIGIYRGLLTVAENQHQLATVIGHEIAHVTADHGNERLSAAFATQAGLELASAVAGGTPTGNRVMAALGLGAQVGVMLPFGRAQETEADIMGLQYMADAGFDPRESLALWRNMDEAAGGGRPPDFLSTHPGPAARSRVLNEHMDDAMARRERAHAEGRVPDCLAPELPARR